MMDSVRIPSCIDYKNAHVFIQGLELSLKYFADRALKSA